MLFTFIIGQCFVSMLCAMHYGVRPRPAESDHCVAVIDAAWTPLAMAPFLCFLCRAPQLSVLSSETIHVRLTPLAVPLLLCVPCRAGETGMCCAGLPVLRGLADHHGADRLLVRPIPMMLKSCTQTKDPRSI